MDNNNLDSMGIEKSLTLFPEQCLQAWNESSHLSIINNDIQNVIVCGMGGSRFTPYTIKFLFKDRINVPYEIVDEYKLPSYASKKSLVILSSYSGTTEEVLSCAKDAISKSCQIAAIASGGELSSLAKENNWTSYIFDPKNNPSGQPRLGAGYMLMGHTGILKSYGLVEVEDSEVQEAVRYAKTISQEDLRIKDVFEFMKGRIISIVGSEHLRGYINGFANQINENAKAMSDFRVISELNHHLMEGLANPIIYNKNAGFIFLNSNLYPERIQKRFTLTKEVVEKQGINTYDLKLEGESKLAQVFEGFVVSGYSTYLLSKHYGVDPIKIPWVDYFKNKLSQPVH